LCACRRNARRGFCSAIHHIAMLIWVHAQWTYPDVWLQLATTQECSFKRADWQSDNKRWNCDGRTICHVTRDINTGQGLNYQRNVFHPSDGPHSLWWRYSAWMEFSFADECHWDNWNVTWQCAQEYTSELSVHMWDNTVLQTGRCCRVQNGVS
jgi:hypothetical protein